MIPAEAREELLRQQLEDQLYAGTLLRDVWRVRELAQLNGAELTEATKHFVELAPELQSRLMDLIFMHGCRGEEQFLCLACQSLAWTSQEHELFEPDEHLCQGAVFASHQRRRVRVRQSCGSTSGRADRRSRPQRNGPTTAR